MSDDLSAFFAKKKDKKKKTAVKLDEVGDMLERKAKRQEEYDHEVVADKGINFTNTESKPSGNAGEESEWIEYGDMNQGRLDGLKIKDLGAENEVVAEEPHESEEPKEQHESTRTWGQVEKKADADVETANDMAEYQQSIARAKFVPSAIRESRYQKAAQIDVSSSEMFPSLADASKIEKDKKDDKPAGGGWIKTGSENKGVTVPISGRGWNAGGPPSAVASGRERDSALAAIKALAAQSAPVAPRAAPAPVAEVSAPAAPSANAYVPPHLRNRN